MKTKTIYSIKYFSVPGYVPEINLNLYTSKEYSIGCTEFYSTKIKAQKCLIDNGYTKVNSGKFEMFKKFANVNTNQLLVIIVPENLY